MRGEERGEEGGEDGGEEGGDTEGARFFFGRPFLGVVEVLVIRRGVEEERERRVGGRERGVVEGRERGVEVEGSCNISGAVGKFGFLCGFLTLVFSNKRSFSLSASVINAVCSTHCVPTLN